MICFWSVTPTAGIYTDCHTLTLHDELPIPADPAGVRKIVGRDGAEAEVEILTTREELPWAGHMAVHALAEVYQRIRRAGTTLVFVNTRAQAEIVFQALWHLNDEGLPIALHHGSLAVEIGRAHV